MVSNDEKNWAMLCHLGGLVHFLPFGQIIVPMIIWMVKREELPFVDDQGKEALNFQISMLIYYLICIPLIFIVIGIFLLAMLGLINLILVILAAVKAQQGEAFRYPLSLNLIK